MNSIIKTFVTTAAFAAMLGFGAQQTAAGPIGLASIGQCPDKSQFISVADVTGNNGGASECWGATKGNDDKNAGFSFNGATYSFVAKVDFEDEGPVLDPEGFDIGLTVTGGGTSSGKWEFLKGLPSGFGDFLIVLKAASDPGYGVWGFLGNPDNTSTFGDWKVAWTAGQSGNPAGLSHLTVYAAPSVIPLPAAAWLLLSGLGGLALLRRRRKEV